MIFPEGRNPDWAGDEDGREYRIQADFDQVSRRLADGRRERATREFTRLMGPAEGRHTGGDGGAHHRPAISRSGCGCGCASAGPALPGSPVDGLLDQLSRQREDPETAYERGRTEARSRISATRGPMSASDVISWLSANRSYNGGPLDG